MVAIVYISVGLNVATIAFVCRALFVLSRHRKRQEEVILCMHKALQLCGAAIQHQEQILLSHDLKLHHLTMEHESNHHTGVF